MGSAGAGVGKAEDDDDGDGNDGNDGGDDVDAGDDGDSNDDEDDKNDGENDDDDSPSDRKSFPKGSTQGKSNNHGWDDIYDVGNRNDNDS